MRNIAIIGSGQAGLLAAHGLINAGYRVTLYSDRTAVAAMAQREPTNRHRRTFRYLVGVRARTQGSIT